MTFRVSGYSIAGYGQMITDAVRMEAYAAALQRAVTPGCTVLDIGAGTGIFSLLACRYGAGRVFAVEPDDAIAVAREIAAVNGYVERITFIQDLSTRLTLPQRADVMVSDLRGVLPLYQHHLASIADARARHLAPGGVSIPQRDLLWAAPVEGQAAHSSVVGLPGGKVLGFDMEPACRLAANSWRRVVIGEAGLLAPPQRWGELDYTTETSEVLSAELHWRVERPGKLHGLVAWFDCELAEGIGFSNAPGGPELIYGQAFFPLARAVPVEPGDVIAGILAADLVGDDYLWRWETRLLAGGDDAQVKVAFRQSTFLGSPVSPATLRKQGARYMPELSEEGQARMMILERMDGRTPLREIARAVAGRYPGLFPTEKDALTLAGELSRKFSR